jgi:DNA polymerase-3 subunit gamma/tau
MTLALARKYRPKSFEDLVGQESVSQTLSQALNQDRLSHAYLFSGLRGSGKTSTARIFAKALLCEQGVSAKPCEQCEQCRSANEGRHIDIVEMDAASNRKIDDIRELIEHTKYKPASGRFKVFIIDEVHMLTKEAFNAILKTLEEPPDFVKFILATTDPLKIPATILSRSQHFRFKKIPFSLVQSHLEHILNEEAIEFEKDAIAIITRSGAGSLRDSLTLLDQAIVYSNGFITKEVVTKMLGIIDPQHIDDLMQRILAKDSDAMIAFVSRFSEYECAMILDETTIFLKEKLLNKDRMLSPMMIERFFRIIAQAKELLHLGSDEEFVLSLTLFKMIEAVSIKDIDSMIEEFESKITSQNLLQRPKSQELNQEISEPSAPVEPKAEEKTDFEKLIAKIYDRDYELGKCFEQNIEFISFENQTLTWRSNAQGECKEQLKQYYMQIKTFVNEVFECDVKIALAPEKIEAQEQRDEKDEEDEPYGSSSCVESNASLQETDSSKELSPKEIVNEPMVKKAAQLFQVEKIKIQSKV